MAQQVKNPPAMQATLETQVWSLGWEDPLEEEVAATAKSLQSCPTMCDPIDGSPPGSPVPEILQGRTLEWVAISFSKAWKWKLKVKSLSPVRLSVTPWTAAHQAPPPVGFSRQECWSGVPFGNPLQYSCLENPTDGGAWRATVYGVTESRTWLNTSTVIYWPPSMCEMLIQEQPQKSRGEQKRRWLSHAHLTPCPASRNTDEMDAGGWMFGCWGRFHGIGLAVDTAKQKSTHWRSYCQDMVHLRGCEAK